MMMNRTEGTEWGNLPTGILSARGHSWVGNLNHGNRPTRCTSLTIWGNHRIRERVIFSCEPTGIIHTDLNNETRRSGFQFPESEPWVTRHAEQKIADDYKSSYFVSSESWQPDTSSSWTSISEPREPWPWVTRRADPDVSFQRTMNYDHRG